MYDLKFSLVTLHVHMDNRDRTIEFYNKLLEMPIISRQEAGPNMELVFLGVEGEPNLEIIFSDEKFEYSGFSIGFDVEDLDLIKERLEVSGYKIKNEFSPSANTTLCFLDGPSGEEVELVHRS